MQLQFYWVPAASPEGSTEELNRFLRSHRVLSVQRELVKETCGTFWAVSVEYLPAAGGGGPAQGGGGGSQQPKVDYREVLSKEDFAVFSQLRQLRKELAEREGVPVYAVFTNEQMAAMVTGRVASVAGMKKIEGIGEGRIEKYGAAVLALLKTPGGGTHEAAGQPHA